MMSLALKKGLADKAPSAEDTPTLPLAASADWGPRLGAWIQDGTVTAEGLDTLAMEAVASLLDPDAPADAQPGADDPWVPAKVEALLGGPDRRFSQLSLLGQGATARVFRAWDHRLERWVALKVLSDVQATGRDRILREARAQARVDHPNLCKVFEVGLQGNLGFIVLPFVEGEALTRWIPGLDIPQKLELVRDIADGLHAAHEAGLVHMDLKPGNILVQRRGDGRLVPLVSDFGMAAGPGLRNEWLPLGTPPFSSPEQLRGEPADSRTDIYALGVILYVLCVGSLPFDGSTFRELLRQIHEEVPVLPRDRMPALSPEIESIILRCLEKNPSLRFSSARQLAQALQGFLDSKRPVLEADLPLSPAPAPAALPPRHASLPSHSRDTSHAQPGWGRALPTALAVASLGLLLLFLGHPLLGVGILGSLAAAAALKLFPRLGSPLSDRAAQWMDLAHAGVPEAAYDLGLAYLGGREGLPQDDATARYWLTQASVRGHEEAMVLLADLSTEGRGGQRDLQQAATWLRRAAEAGHAGAQARLQRLESGR